MNILLVNAAYHTHECWNDFIPELEKFGFNVKVAKLSGHNLTNKTAYTITMSSYICDLVEAAFEFDSPCLILAHSMAGMIASGAADKYPHLFSGVIYLCAVLPEKHGTSIMDFGRKFKNYDVAKNIKWSPLTMTLSICPENIIKQLYNDCNLEQQEKVKQFICKQPMIPMFNKVSWGENLEELPKAYIKCKKDKVFHHDTQRALSKYMNFTIVEALNTDHSPFLSMPDTLAISIKTISEQLLEQ